jgi:DNA-binding PadR family transcriptional regulator
MPAATPPEPLNNTARVLLGMVAEGHSTGYAIKAEIERSTRLYWGASVGGIYPELKRLTEAGLLKVRDDPRGGARRHCYSLARSGRRALHDWLTDGGEPAFEMRNEALLKLRFAGVLELDEQLEVVQALREGCAARAQELEARLKDGDFDDHLHRMTIEFGAGFNAWARDWCDGAERQLKRASGARAAS